MITLQRQGWGVPREAWGLLVLLAMLGCAPASDGEPSGGPAAGASWDLAEGNGVPVVRLLDVLSNGETGVVSVQLPARSRPDDEVVDGRFVLDEPWDRVSKGRVWRIQSPVEFPHQRYRDNPPSVELQLNGEVLPYVAGSSARGVVPRGWEVVENRIYLVLGRNPGDLAEPPVLVHEGYAELERMFHFADSGMSAESFVERVLTVGSQTRRALFLPAPASASFAVAVPAGGVLRFGWAMADPPAESAPAEAAFRVFVDDEEVWAGQAKTGDKWKEAKVQLRRWAGKNVTIRFETVAGDSSVGDFCAFSNPEVVGAVDDAEPRRIVMVGIDTLRPDHLGVNGGRTDVSPAFDRIASESFVFSHARAPAPRTRPSFRTATTGRWPLLAIGSPTMGELMRKEGFASAGIVANVHLMARLGMAAGYHHWDYDPKRNSKAQVDKALSWLNAHANEDSFLFLHIMDPHIFYLPPEPYRDQYTEGLDPGPLSDKYNRWTVQALERKDELSDENRAYVQARYDGEIAYVDSEVGRLVQAVDALPGRTTMVFISDHGEEFWEHGAFEHNHSLYDELMRVLLWIRPPGGQVEAARVIDAPVSLADVVPTMLDLVGVQASVEFEGVSLRPMLDELYSSQRSALDAALQERLFPLGHMMFAKERWGVFSGGWKYILHTMSGQEELYDLTADPTEQTNRTDTETGALGAWRDKLAAATGATVGAGWRISMSAKTPPFRLVFDALEDGACPAEQAGVIDPEAGRSHRANLEWGEVPSKLAVDVAEVIFLEEECTVVVTPGAQPKGVLFVLGPDQATTGSLAYMRDGVEVTEALNSDLKPIGSPASKEPFFRVGTLFLATDSEAAHLASVRDPDAIRALRALGYVE